MPPASPSLFDALGAVERAGTAYAQTKQAVREAHAHVTAVACSLRDLGHQRCDLERAVKRPLDSWIESPTYTLIPTATIPDLRAALVDLRDCVKAQKTALDKLTDAAGTARRVGATLPAIANRAGVKERYAQQLVLRDSNGHQWAAKSYRQAKRPKPAAVPKPTKRKKAATA